MKGGGTRGRVGGERAKGRIGDEGGEEKGERGGGMVDRDGIFF